MAGKFINTNKKDMINSAVSNLKNSIDNIFVFAVNEKPTIVTYYNINEEKTVLDIDGTMDTYEIIGKNSPIRYDKIRGLPIAGFDKIIAQLETTEMGIEGNEITGEVTIFPDTIKAHVNDMFVIPYLEENLIFQITEVQYDTLDTGSNYSRVQYTLYGGSSKYIMLERQVVENYDTIIDNIGSTGFKAIIKSEFYTMIEKFQSYTVTLKDYYKMLFYNNKVQTFTFFNTKKDTIFYDPYMIEFLKRNEILSGATNYLCVQHQCSLHQTFVLDYDSTFLRCIEKKDRKGINKYNIMIVGELIKDITSIFNTRLEDYYKVTYKYPDTLINYMPMNIIEADLIRRIKEVTFYNKEENSYLNIIIKFFNDIDLSEEDIESIDNINFNDNILMYYYIPIIIYCIENFIKHLLVKHVDK